MGGFEPTTFRSESDNTNHCATEVVCDGIYCLHHDVDVGNFGVWFGGICHDKEKKEGLISRLKKVSAVEKSRGGSFHQG